MARMKRVARAFMFALIVTALPSAALAQLPLPRLQSISTLSGRAGENVDLTLNGTDLDGANALWFDHPGLRAFHLKGAIFRVAIAPGTPAGRHDLRVVSPLGVSNPRTFIVSDQPESIEKEPNNLPEQATALPPGSFVTGVVQPTDVDCFAFEGKAGERVFVEVWATRLDSRLNATVRVFDPKGAVIAESLDDTAVDPVLEARLPADGRYTIRLHDIIYTGSADHVYRLGLSKAPRLDAVMPAAALPGQPAQLALLGRGLGGTVVPDMQVEGQPLERSELTIIPQQADAPTTLLDWFVPAPAASRRGFTCRASGPGGASNPFFVALARDPVVVEQEPNDGGARVQVVTPPCDITGTFGRRGDLDVYRFKGKKGEAWWFDASAERIGSPADPMLVVQKVVPNAPPQDLANADDLPDQGGMRFSTASVDCALRWQVPEDGEYQVAVSDLHSTQRGDARLVYRLNIRPDRPDFALFLVPENQNTMEGLTLRTGGRANGYVFAERFDGFNRPIQVEPVGLPPGVSCDPIVIGPGQALAPVVFTAAENAKPTEAVVLLAGRGLSGDRKEILDQPHGAPVQPEIVHEAAAGGLIWPMSAPNGQITPGPARLTRGFVIAIREGAPFQLNAHPARLDIAPGGNANLEVDVVRRKEFTEAVQLTTADLPPNMGAVGGTIAKDKNTATLNIAVPANVPPGTYTLLVRGTGPFPFSKDPNAKQKPNVNVNEPSNPIILTVRK